MIKVIFSLFIFTFYILAFSSVQASTAMTRFNTLGHSAKGQYVLVEEIKIDHEQKRSQVQLKLLNVWRKKEVKVTETKTIESVAANEVDQLRKSMVEGLEGPVKRYGINLDS